jgi:putative oxidoreductase
MGSLLRVLTQTNNDIACLILRVLLAVVFFAHGAQKVLGWFGGRGLEATMAYFTKVHHLPVELAVLPIAAEFLGSIGLFLGLLTRVAAFAIAVDMAVAVYLVHLKFGFFVNWSGKQPGEGFEFHILVFAIALALMIKGSGSWSVDRLISRKN